MDSSGEESARLFSVKASAFCCAFALNLDNFIRTPPPGPARGSDAMTRFVQGGIQTVVTTTNLSYFPAELLDAAEVIPYGPAS